jgi:hypothetical protein
MTKGVRVAAFDPGERTGYVVVLVEASFDAKTGDGFVVEQQGVLTVRQVGHQLREILEGADVVAYETWRLYETHAMQMIGNDMQPSQIVGMIRYEAWQQNKKVVSNGADIKKMAYQTMPQWLKDHLTLSSEQHDVDAILHAWYVSWRHHYTGGWGG